MRPASPFEFETPDLDHKQHYTYYLINIAHHQGIRYFLI